MARTVPPRGTELLPFPSQGWDNLLFPTPWSKGQRPRFTPSPSSAKRRQADPAVPASANCRESTGVPPPAQSKAAPSSGAQQPTPCAPLPRPLLCNGAAAASRPPTTAEASPAGKGGARTHPQARGPRSGDGGCSHSHGSPPPPSAPPATHTGAAQLPHPVRPPPPLTGASPAAAPGGPAAAAPSPPAAPPPSSCRSR